MKNTILLMIAILLATISMKSQDLLLTWEGDTLGSTHTVWGEPDSSEIVFHAVVHNNTGNWMKIKVRRNQVEMLDSTSSYFCWGVCFDDDVEESPDSILVPSGGSSVDDAFSGHYIPKNKNGTSMVEYMFYNMENEEQNVKVLVKYWTSPENIVEDMVNSGSISDIYPNPAATFVNIDYEIPAEVKSAQIRIINLFGHIVKEQAIKRNKNRLTMDISELEAGIYFYTLLIDNRIYHSKKLIIQKN